MEDDRNIQKDIALLDLRLKRVEQQLDKISDRLDNGISESIAVIAAKTGELTEAILRGDLKFEALVKEIHRIDKSLTESRTRVSILMTIFGIAIGAILMYAFDKFFQVID